MRQALVLLVLLLGGCGFFAAFWTAQQPNTKEVQGIVRVPADLGISGNEGGALVGVVVEAIAPPATESLAKAVTSHGGAFHFSLDASHISTALRVQHQGLTLLAPLNPWSEISPGSTVLVQAFAELDPQLLGSVDQSAALKLAKALDRDMPSSLSDLKTQVDALGRRLGITLAEKEIEAKTISGIAPFRLRTALFNQMMRCLLASSDPLDIEKARSELDLRQAIAQAQTPYLYWATSQVSTLSAILVLGDPTQHQQATVRVSSLAEPLGENVPLKEISSGTFMGEISLARLYNDQGQGVVASDGKLTVYAEGDTPQMLLVAKYQGLEGYAIYREPSSTLSGVLLVDGKPFSKASVTARKGSMGYKAVSRADGSYALYDLPSGEYLLVAERDGKTLSEYRRVP